MRAYGFFELESGVLVSFDLNIFVPAKVIYIATTRATNLSEDFFKYRPLNNMLTAVGLIVVANPALLSRHFFCQLIIFDARSV